MGRLCSIQVTGAGQVDVWVNTRDHCEPHVHCGDKANSWEGRIKFSFLDNLPLFWDCLSKKDPGIGAFNAVIQVLPGYLHKARTFWWGYFDTSIGCCLANQMFPDAAGKLRQIRTAVYDSGTNMTHLTFTNGFVRDVDLN